MKNLLSCLAVTILVISLVFCASSALAVTCDYNITNCTTISISGNWCMNQSITTSTTDECISITSENVTLNGLGNNLNGTLGLNGIRIYQKDVTILNINITNWNYAIYTTRNNTNITNTSITHVTQSVHIIGSGTNGHNSAITYCNIINASDTGIYVSGSNNNNVSHNVINSEGGGQYGLRLYNSRDNYVQANNLTTIDFTMTFAATNNTYIDSNIIDKSNLGGFLLINSNYNNLSNNYIYQPNQSAFEINSSNYNILFRNNITDAKNHGFKVNDATGNNLTSNIVRDVNATGFYLQNVTNSTVSLNLITNVSQCGLQIKNSLSTNITNNTFENPTTGQGGSYAFDIYNVNGSRISYNNMINLTYKGFLVNLSNNNSLIENNYTTEFIGQGFKFLILENSNSNQISGLYFISLHGEAAAVICLPLFSFLNSNFNNLSNVLAQSIILSSNREMILLTNSNNNTLQNLTFANNACATFDFYHASYNKILNSISDLYVDFSMGNDSHHTSFNSNQSSLSNEIRFLRMRFYGDLNSTIINISAFGNDFALSPTKYPPAAPRNISQFFNFTKTVMGGINENVNLNVTYNEAELGYALESTLTMNYSQPGGIGWGSIPNQGINLDDNYVWSNIGSTTLPEQLTTTYFGLFADHNYPPEVILNAPANDTYLRYNQFNFTATDYEEIKINCSIYLNGVYNQSNTLTQNNTLTTFTIPGIPSGHYNWNVSCNDSINAGWSQTWIVRVDSTMPVPVQGQNPIDYYNDSDGSVTFDFKCYDNEDVSMIQLWTDTTGIWQPNYSNSGYTNNTWLNISVEGIPQGLNYHWAVWCNDTQNNSAITSNRTFSVDETSPIAYQGANPVDNYNSSSSSITFDMKCTDSVSVSMIKLYTNASGTWQAEYTNDTYTNNTWINWTLDGLPSGLNHQWAVWCNDTAGLTNTTQNRTFNIDTTYPVPTQGQNPIDYYNDSDGSVTFDFKCYDNINVSMIQLWTTTTGGWTVNYSNSSYTNDTWLNITLPGISEGNNYQWYVWCNDTFNNTASTNPRIFDVDTTAPVAVLGDNPVNNYNYSSISKGEGTQNTINFEIKCYDQTAVSRIQLWTNTTGTWKANYTNDSYTNNTLLTIQVIGIPEGMNYKWGVWCNDSVGFSNTTQNRTFNVDTIKPIITIDYPLNRTYFKYAPRIDGDCFDGVSGVNAIWSNATEYPQMETASPFNFTNESSLTDGVYLLQIRCNDSLNNTASSLVNFTYDITNPSITFIAPTPDNETNLTIRKVIINVSLGDTNPSMVWLNWNGIEEQNQSWTSGALTFTKHNLFNGYYNYTVTVTDLAGNSNTSETRIVGINSPTPVVELIYPANNNYSNLTWTNFTCNLTSIAGRTIKNVTFYWNYTGEWLANESVTGLTNQNEIVAFNRSLENKSVMWNCLAYDNESDGEWSTQNYTFTSDRVNPIAHQGANPVDNYNSSSSSMVFDIKCTDNFGLSAMQLWTNTTGVWLANYTNSNYTNNTWFNVTVAGIPDATNYKWSVYCRDKAGNSHVTANRTFSVDIIPPEAYFGVQTVNGTINNSRSITFDLKCTDNQNVFAIALYGDWNNKWELKNITLSPGNNTWINYNYTLNPNEADRAYHWNVFCNDSTSNSVFNSTNRTYILDTTAPIVSLNTPNNGNHTNSTSVTFNCSATDTNLSNITLYGNLSGGWQADETKTASGRSSYSTFTKILTTNNDYIWNCYVCDGLGQCSYGSQNYTLSVDTNYPQLTLLSPEDGAEFDSSVTSVTFQWITTDSYSPTLDCNIYTKGRYQTTKVCNNATTCSQAISFSNGASYSWRINCSDGINQNISDTRTFLINRPSEGEGGGGGGGGGSEGGYCGDNYCNRQLGTYIFNCSAYNYSQLYNISLYGSWSPGWHIDELRNVNGQNIEISFNKVFTVGGSYLWNCYVCGRLPSGYLKCSFVMKNQTAIVTTTGGDENQNNCCRDCGCPSGQNCADNTCSIIESCGNGVCDTIESPSNCCTDCACPSGQICTAEGCTSHSYCGDQVCDSSIGETLDNCPLDCIFSPVNCGDNYCDRTFENVATCPQDCKAVCGNDICENTENQSACCKDCGCPSGQSCANNKCSKKSGDINLSGFWNITKKAFLPLIIIIIAILIALGAYFFIKKYKQKSLIQVMMDIGKEIDKKKVNEVQARIRKEQPDFSIQNKKIRASIDQGLKICQDVLAESIEKGEIAAVAQLVETKKELLKKIMVLFNKYIDILKKERSPFEHNLKEIIISEEIPLYENLKKNIGSLYNVGRKIALQKSPLKIGN